MYLSTDEPDLLSSIGMLDRLFPFQVFPAHCYVPIFHLSDGFELLLCGLPIVYRPQLALYSLPLVRAKRSIPREHTWLVT